MKKIIALIAPPGAGKGTQANLLAEHFDMAHLETSKILEKRIMNAKEGELLEIDGKEFPFSEEKRKWETGEICSPLFTARLVVQEVEALAKEGKGIIFSGSPRSIFEADQELPIFEKLYGRENIVILNIKLSFKESIKRNSNRKICSLMRHPILWNEETAKLKHCPLDGSELLTRKLDNPEVIKARLKEFEEKTFPVLDHLEKKGLKVQGINGEQSVEEVFKEILANIKD